jgi:regulator of sigma E protease
MFDFLLQNDTLSAIVAFVLVLIPAVIIHEIGHFVAAKTVGITILEFGIGLPPRMVKLFTYKGTDYTLNWIPLGGFVRPLGEDIVRQLGDESTEEDRKEAEARGIQKTKSVNEARPLSRIWFLAGGALANFVMALVLFAVIALIGLPTITGGRTNVLYVTPGSSLGEAGLQPLDAVEAVNDETYLFSDELIARLYALEGETVTLRVRRVGVEEPIMLTAQLPDVDTALSQQSAPVIVGVADDSPAQDSGLQPLDLIRSLNGVTVSNNEELRDLVMENRGSEVTLRVLREGQEIEVQITPRIEYPQDQGSMGVQLAGAPGMFAEALGLTFQDGDPQQAVLPLAFGDAISYATTRFSEVISTIASVPGRILSGDANEEELRLTSIVGISQIGSFYLQESIERNQPTLIIEYIALISLVLGLTNLLPIPALDGGRILFVIIEVIRGRPIAPEREGMVHLIGLALLLSLMVVVMFNDIVNPLTDMLR